MLCWNKLEKNLKKKIVKEGVSMQRNKNIRGYCPRCGNPYDSSTRFCPKCGADLVVNIKYRQGKQIPTYDDHTSKMENDAKYWLARLSKREKTSGIIWIVTAIIQIIIAIPLFPFLPTYIAAILNIYIATVRFKQSKLILNPNKELLEKYKYSRLYDLSFWCNILLGGFIIGLVGHYYDDRTREYALNNGGLLLWYCEVR